MARKDTKKVLVLAVVTLVTLVLGAIALFTALRLNRVATEPVAPTAPTSRPKAAIDASCVGSFDVSVSLCNGWCDSNDDCARFGDEEPQMICIIPEGETNGNCRLSILPEEEDCEAETEELICNEVCTDSSGCDTDYCLIAEGEETGVCRNESCEEEESCECPGATPTPSPTPEPTPTPTPEPTPGPTPTPTPTTSDGGTTTTTTPPGEEVPEQQLPEAGSIIPTSTMLGIGGALLMIGALSLLLL